jgi:hypothetical protein
MNVKIRSIEDYIKFPLSVIKPHGSCNWFKGINPNIRKSHSNISKRELSNFLYQSDNIDFTKKIVNNLSSDIIISDASLYNTAGYEPDAYQILFPQILIPLKTKDEFIMPGEHLKFLESSLEIVDEILIIGWKANEIFFNELLKKTLTSKTVKILTVCKDEGSSLVTKLSKIIESTSASNFDYPGMINKTRIDSGTFSSFNQNFQGIAIFDFFRS